MKKGIKHEHKMTNCLKAIIFSCLMLAPLLAVGSKIAYTTFNKNAYQSYKGTYSYNTTIPLINYINEYEESELNISPNSWKNFDLNNVPTSNATIQFNSINYGGVLLYCNNFENRSNFNINIPNNYDFVLITIRHYQGFYINLYFYTGSFEDYDWSTTGNYNQPNGYVSSLSGNNYINNKDILCNLNITSNKAKFFTISNTINRDFYNNIIYYTYIYDNTLSSVFYSAVDELDDASIFSWTTNTAIYTAINNMCVTLGIVSPPLAVLLTYWTLLTIIYVIIDIVIETFIFLTHWLNDKMV